jgi:hypothetical protein
MGLMVSTGVIGRRWPTALAVALSAGSLAASLAGFGARAQAASDGARAAAASPAASRASAQGWRVAATLGSAALVSGVSASGKDNAWVSAVTCTVCSNLADYTGRQLRWDGTAWRPVALPAAYTFGFVVPASPAGNWIVGAVPVSMPTRNVVLHWTAKGRGTTTLLDENVGISAGVAPTATQAWLFGDTEVGGPDGGSYALHYAGSTWRPAKVPFVGTAASASSPTNVWAYGYRPGDGLVGTMAFNGKKWRTVLLPPPPSSLSYTSPGYIAAASPSNVWLEIGLSSGIADPAPYLLHWTGARWISIKIPYGLEDAGLTTIAQDGRGGVWLSLMDLDKNLTFPKAFLLHYRDGAWTRITVPVTAGYKVLEQVSLAWIPGTRSLWGAVAELNPKSPKSPGKLLLLKYGP